MSYPLAISAKMCYNGDINKKRHRLDRQRFVISDIRKGAGNTDAELGVTVNDSAAPLRIWLIDPIITWDSRKVNMFLQKSLADW